MVVKDAALASLFFNNGGTNSETITNASTSMVNSKAQIVGLGRHSMLTLENIRLHDRSI